MDGLNSRAEFETGKEDLVSSEEGQVDQDEDEDEVPREEGQDDHDEELCEEDQREDE